MNKPLKYILHLDDHVLFQNGIQRAITDITDDYRIIHFQHPDEALNYIETSFEIDNPVDIIISDYNHPGIKGYEFACAVRVLERTYKRRYKIPLFMISMVGSYFHPGKETIEEFIIHNKQNEIGNKVFSIELIVRGIQEQVIDASLGKNCTGEQVVEFLNYLTTKPFSI